MNTQTRSSLSPLKLAAVCLALAVFAVGCAGYATYDTGLPAEAAPKFFFHMEQEAQARGYDAWRSSDNSSLSVETDLGELDYNVLGDEIVVNVNLRRVDKDMTDNAIRLELAKLYQLNESLIEDAISRAERAKVFEHREIDALE